MGYHDTSVLLPISCVVLSGRKLGMFAQKPDMPNFLKMFTDNFLIQIANYSGFGFLCFVWLYFSADHYARLAILFSLSNHTTKPLADAVSDVITLTLFTFVNFVNFKLFFTNLFTFSFRF